VPFWVTRVQKTAKDKPAPIAGRKKKNKSGRIELRSSRRRGKKNSSLPAGLGVCRGGERKGFVKGIQDFVCSFWISKMSACFADGRKDAKERGKKERKYAPAPKGGWEGTKL